MNKDDILEILNNQRDFFNSNKMLNYKYRIAALKKLYENIKKLTPEINAALMSDLNKSEVESYMAEIGQVLSEITFMIKHCKKFAAVKKVPTPLSQFHATSYKMPCAYGGVLVISPWNYPFMLALVPMVDAISAGNSVIIKPSETAPNVSEVIKLLVDRTFEKGHVDVVLGGVEECSFLLEQNFDYIFYTGSTRVGKIVMQKAAEHFTPVTLEMGGKSPCIVDESADINLSAKRIVFGKFLNCGQTCVAPDYIYCHKSIYNKLISAIICQIIKQYSLDPINNETYPKMINETQFDNMLHLINEPNILFGGKFDRAKLKIEPTILKADLNDLVMHEEIFGPILPIITFDNLEEVVETINHKLCNPLALYIFSLNKKNQNKILTECHFGGACVNDTIIHISSAHLGFGGIKESGIGAYHGKIGFDTFTHYKSIVNKKTWMDLPLRYQPYNKFKFKLIKKFLK